jgi:hypothetical protein
VIARVRKIITSLSIAAAFMVPIAVPAIAAAQTPPPNIPVGLCTGANLSTTPATNCTGEETGGTINNLIATVINIFSLVVGVVAVIMIIIGGLKYITSGGDSSNITGAKNTILYAIIGLVIVALAQVIVRFVLGKVTPS